MKNKLKYAFTLELPGWQSHLKLAPKERVDGILERKSNKSAKLSAVMLVLFKEDNQIKILLILRSEYDGAHSGQISFPGGQKEGNDFNLKETAIRETFEEVSIKINQEDVLGKLTNLYIPNSNFIVEPYVAFVDDNMENLFPDYSEVQQIYKVALDELLDEKTIQLKEVMSRNNHPLIAPCFYVNKLKIWGATAMILNELIDIIKRNDSIY